MLGSPELGGVGGQRQEQDPAAHSCRGGGCCWQGRAVELAVQVVVCPLGYLKVSEVGLGTSDQK